MPVVWCILAPYASSVCTCLVSTVLPLCTKSILLSINWQSLPQLSLRINKDANDFCTWLSPRVVTLVKLLLHPDRTCLLCVNGALAHVSPNPNPALPICTRHWDPYAVMHLVHGELLLLDSTSPWLLDHTHLQAGLGTFEPPPRLAQNSFSIQCYSTWTTWHLKPFPSCFIYDFSTSEIAISYTVKGHLMRGKSPNCKDHHFITQLYL